MRRALLLGFLGWLVQTSPLSAVPVRPLFEPPAIRDPLDLTDSLWDSKDVAEDRLIAFLSDGKLKYGPHQSPNGVWRVEGNIVYFSINDGYRMFHGIVMGDIIQGESWNIDATQWRTTLYRVRPKK